VLNWWGTSTAPSRNPASYIGTSHPSTNRNNPKASPSSIHPSPTQPQNKKYQPPAALTPLPPPPQTSGDTTQYHPPSPRPHGPPPGHNIANIEPATHARKLPRSQPYSPPVRTPNLLRTRPGPPPGWRDVAAVSSALLGAAVSFGRVRWLTDGGVGICLVAEATQKERRGAGAPRSNVCLLWLADSCARDRIPWAGSRPIRRAWGTLLDSLRPSTPCRTTLLRLHGLPHRASLGNTPSPWSSSTSPPPPSPSKLRHTHTVGVADCAELDAGTDDCYIACVGLNTERGGCYIACVGLNTERRGCYIACAPHRIVATPSARADATL
jgi:hypothetical protein